MLNWLEPYGTKLHTWMYLTLTLAAGLGVKAIPSGPPGGVEDVQIKQLRFRFRAVRFQKNLRKHLMLQTSYE